MEQDGEYRKLLEAALFMSSGALGAKELGEITGIASPGIVGRLLDELKSEYSGRDSSIEVLEIDGRYMLSIKEPYAKRLGSMANAPDISRGSLRLLAYISRNNGVLQSSVVKYFGSGTYEHVKELTEKGFLEYKKQGRSKKLSVTGRFREYFSS